MISHHHKCIFVHIPKCGGQSIETAFLHDIGLDWRRRAPLLLRPNNDPDLGPPVLSHLLAKDYVALGYIPQDVFDAYFKFAVVRNPYRRVVSMYQYLPVKQGFSDFVRTTLTNDKSHPLFYFVRPQSDYIVADDKVIVDAIYNLESISEGFESLRTRIGLKTDLPHVNASSEKNTQEPLKAIKSAIASLLRGDTNSVFGKKEKHTEWQNYFDKDSQARVTEYYANDFEMLGYSAKLSVS